MSLTLYFHPLSSFCQKALIALYECGVPFDPHIVNLGDADAFAAFKRLWPIGRIPALHDAAADRTVPEATIIIEYLAQQHGAAGLVPAEPELALRTRLADRFYDLYVNVPMQKIVTDRLRPEGCADAYGVEQARALLTTALGMVEAEMATRSWAVGDTFSMADCAAAPPLFYANEVIPFGGTYANAARYLDRLKARPSFARALAEAEPYMTMFPR